MARRSRTAAARPADEGPIPVLPTITRRQAQCLEFIYGYLDANRDYPTQREIATAMAIKQSSAAAVIEALEKKGYLSRLEGVRRNIRLSEAGLEKLRLSASVRETQLPLFGGDYG